VLALSNNCALVLDDGSPDKLIGNSGQELFSLGAGATPTACIQATCAKNQGRTRLAEQNCQGADCRRRCFLA